jgi:hypothetical protein
MKQHDDPTIARVREARHRISEACGHDPQRLVDYYIELQKKYEHRLHSKLEPKSGLNKHGRSIHVNACLRSS